MSRGVYHAKKVVFPNPVLEWRKTMKKSFVAITIALLVLSVLASTTFAAPAAAEKQVPFKGQSNGVVVTTGFEDPCVSIDLNGHPCVVTFLEGEGEATQLGHFTVTDNVVVDVVTGIATGPWTLTAANGDMLFVSFVGYGIDPTHGGGDMTVVGGTGRFEGATGHYTQRITFSNTPGTLPSVSYTDVLEGVISTPGGRIQ
jgi:hypothetical protein